MSRYAGAGVLNAVVGLGSIFVFTWLGANPSLANVAGYALGLVVAFFTARSYVFRARGKAWGEAVRYLLAFTVSFGCNFAVLHVALRRLELTPELAQAAAVATYVGVMYLASRLFVFTKVRDAQPERRGCGKVAR